jgi:hypothetical protein
MSNRTESGQSDHRRSDTGRSPAARVGPDVPGRSRRLAPVRGSSPSRPRTRRTSWVSGTLRRATDRCRSALASRSRTGAVRRAQSPQRGDRTPLRLPVGFGTFPPSRRASLRPIAIACFRLVTLFPDRPDSSVPRLRSCRARSTLFCAVLPYFAIWDPPLLPCRAAGGCCLSQAGFG